MEFIQTKNAPFPAGHYSQAVVVDKMIYVSGQLPINPISNEKITGPISEQTTQVIKNLQAILEAADSDLSHIVKTTVYISDISLWNDVNKVYSELFGIHKPARAIVPTKDLHFGFKIEMDAIAVIPK